MKKIGTVLREARERNNFEIKEVISLLEKNGIFIKKQTLYSYETNTRSMTPDTFLALCKIYKIKNILQEFDDVDMNDDSIPTDKEWSIIEKYRLLDDYGIRAVDAVLGVEYDRCITSASRVMDNIRPIRYYQKTASAGPGQILFDDPAIDRIDIPNTNDYCRVAYAVGVNGDSMEPDYQDGDILLIEPATDLQIGEVGIFYVDGKSYVKKLGDGELISLNPAYDPIPLDVYSRCMGRVIDKL